jgi:hypothetical protein
MFVRGVYMVQMKKYEMELYKFIERDHLKTLFPLNSVKLIAKYCLKNVLNFINEEILKQKPDESQSHFFMQSLVYALKDKNHVRQTFLLDPIAQIFLYDFVYRNREHFKQTEKKIDRINFGYSFVDDSYNSPSEEYKNFTEMKYKLKSQYKYMGRIDIANCFNNIYHHDMVSYISMLINMEESQKIGRFLREINGGRSTDCLPQGLFPAKVLGNFFLSFIENSRELKSEKIIRFMDDLYLFSDNQQTIIHDIFIIQRLIAEKGLYLNEEKTKIHETDKDEEHIEIEDIKKSILRKRREIINSYTGELESTEEIKLSQEEIDFLTSKLHVSKKLEDDDIELILAVLSTTPEEMYELVDVVINNHPQLTKNLYFNLKRNIENINNDVINLIVNYIKRNPYIHEYQLFWLTKILIDFTYINEHIANVLFDIYKHNSSTNVVKCLILELQENNYGLLELKKSVVRGSSHELVISALIGLVSYEKGNRNQIYKYVGKMNSMFRVITNSLKELECDAMDSLIEPIDHKVQFIPQEDESSFLDLFEDKSAIEQPIDIWDDDLPF